MKYSKQKVDKLILEAIRCTIKGMEQFIDNETIVIKKGTKEEIPDCEIELKKGPKKLSDYICSILEAEAGIKISERTIAEQEIAKKQKGLWPWLFGFSKKEKHKVINLNNTLGPIKPADAPTLSTAVNVPPTRPGILKSSATSDADGNGYWVTDVETNEKYPLIKEDGKRYYNLSRTVCSNLYLVEPVQYFLAEKQSHTTLQFARIPSLNK